MEEARQHSALGWLRAGNARFLASKPDLPKVHRPRVAVLTCADARLDPYRIFDAEPGSLFIVRNAGNIADGMAVASLRFGLSLGAEGVVVLGHSDCGAVKATLDGVVGFEAITAPIRAHFAGTSQDPIAAAAEHVRATAGRLREQLSAPVWAALYQTEEGNVRWLD